MQRTSVYVGECIYCRSKNGLSDEHAIPFALKGNNVLEKASCSACAAITSRFELSILRRTMIGPRTVLELPTRRKKQRPLQLPMIFVRGDVKTEELVPIDDAVPVLVLPELGPPESLRTLRHVAGLNHGDFKPNVHTFPIERDAEHLRQLLAKYQADAVEIPWEIDHEDFRRMLAKIAMCEAIFCFGYQQFEEIYLRSAILGNDRTSYWVGSDGAYDIYLEGGFDDSSHVFAIMRPHGYTEVWTRIKLWNKSMTPEYLVVVGRLRPSYARFLDAHHLIA